MKPVFDAKTGASIIDILDHCLFLQTQLLGDLRRSLALGDAGEAFQLAWRQLHNLFPLGVVGRVHFLIYEL